MILPTKAKNYLKAKGNKSKNYKIDAKGLAGMWLDRTADAATVTLIENHVEKPLQLRLLTRQLKDYNN